VLALLREHEAAERPITPLDIRFVQNVLSHASRHLTILDPELGDQALIKSVAAELAKLPHLGEV